MKKAEIFVELGVLGAAIALAAHFFERPEFAPYAAIIASELVWARYLLSQELEAALARSEIKTQQIIIGQEEIADELTAFIRRSETAKYDEALPRVLIEVMASLCRKRLADGKCQTFLSEQEWIGWLTDTIQQIGPQARIEALCLDKEWTSVWVEHYVCTNEAAAKRGVQIHRVFGDANAPALRAAERQHKAGIDVHIVRDTDRLLELAHLRRHSGFVVLDTGTPPVRVLVHEGSDNGRAALIDDPVIVAHFRSTHRLAITLGKPF